MDGYHLLEGYELSPAGERRDDCNVYELTPPPTIAPRIGSPNNGVYYVYPMVIDVAGKKIYSPVNFPDLRETSQGTQIQGAPSGGSAQSGCLPGPGSSQPGKDLSFLKSLLAQGMGSYVPPVVVSGKNNVQLAISKMTNDAVLSRGFAREVVIAKPGDAVHLPNGYSFWPIYELNQPRPEGGQQGYGSQQAINGTMPPAHFEPQLAVKTVP